MALPDLEMAAVTAAASMPSPVTTTFLLSQSASTLFTPSTFDTSAVIALLHPPHVIATSYVNCI